jgi:hypothetical protein
MSNPFKRTASALAIVLALAHVAPIAADLLVCIDDRTDRDCCEASFAQDTPVDVAARFLERADCGCCVTVRINANTADATAPKPVPDLVVESGVAGGHVAPVTRRIASSGRDEPDNARLPLRTVVLLI